MADPAAGPDVLAMLASLPTDELAGFVAREHVGPARAGVLVAIDAQVAKRPEGDVVATVSKLRPTELAALATRENAGPRRRGVLTAIDAAIAAKTPEAA